MTSVEAAKVLGVSPGSVSASLERQRKAGRIISVTKGGWVPVPPQYRQAGAPPPINYIDQFMKFLGHGYYVGFLSAASLHGASHQSPMVFQAATSGRLRDRIIGGSRINFVLRSDISEKLHRQVTVPTGRVEVSTPEVTVCDLVESPRLGGGLSNVATVIGELIQDAQLDVDEMVTLTQRYPVSVLQRVGYLLEFMAQEVDTKLDLECLAEVIAGVDFTLLVPGKNLSGLISDRWRLRVNTVLEHDL